MIALPDKDYRPPTVEREKEHGMPGASPGKVRRAFFRPFTARREKPEQSGECDDTPKAFVDWKIPMAVLVRKPKDAKETTDSRRRNNMIKLTLETINSKSRKRPIIELLTTISLILWMSNGFAQAASRISTDSLKEEHHMMFKGFYGDSIDIFVEVAKEDVVNMHLEDFTKLPLDVKTNICSVIVDYVAFRSFVSIAFLSSFEKEVMIFLMGKAKMISGDSLYFRNISSKYKAISKKSEFCLENNIVQVAFSQFVEHYVPVPMEFKLRDLYRSQMPLIQWIRENVPPSEEKEDLERLIESMERKYLLTFEPFAK